MRLIGCCWLGKGGGKSAAICTKINGAIENCRLGRSVIFRFLMVKDLSLECMVMLCGR